MIVPKGTLIYNDESTKVYGFFNRTVDTYGSKSISFLPERNIFKADPNIPDVYGIIYYQYNYWYCHKSLKQSDLESVDFITTSYDLWAQELLIAFRVLNKDPTIKMMLQASGSLDKIEAFIDYKTKIRSSKTKQTQNEFERETEHFLPIMNNTPPV